LVLYRIRYLLVAPVALMPFMTVGIFHWMVNIEGSPHTWDVAGPTLFVLAVLIDFWGFTLLGAVLGVRTALLRTNAGVVVMVVLGQLITADPDHALHPGANCHTQRGG
jgi:hypothetical protein